MKYDPSNPIAVFLGPSLERDRGREVLSANYYPPARLGDIYKLIGSGVRAIVLIDGVFHSTPSVWQREVLEAVSQGIRVIGASSMGALRAAELYPFGVTGIGTIFEWYRDGVINGDDEVTLNHEDESRGFRKLSEPLVNIRFGLERASEEGYLTPEEADSIIAYLKQFCYWHRSKKLIFDCEVVESWSPEKREQLKAFLDRDDLDLKRADAMRALQLGASIAGGTSFSNAVVDRKAPEISRYLENSHYYRIGICKRGLFDPDGHLMATAEVVIQEVLKEPESVKRKLSDLSKGYFLLQYYRDRSDLNCPSTALQRYAKAWRDKYVSSDEPTWLRSNGLVPQEFESRVEELALVEWLLEQDPLQFGFDFDRQHQIARSLDASTLSGQNQDGNGSLEKQLKANLYIASWAKKRGISRPDSEVEGFISSWLEKHHFETIQAASENLGVREADLTSVLSEWALVDWMCQKSPRHFGLRSWNPEVALIRELQVAGEAATIAQKILERTPNE